MAQSPRISVLILTQVLLLSLVSLSASKSLEISSYARVARNGAAETASSPVQTDREPFNDPAAHKPAENADM